MMSRKLTAAALCALCGSASGQITVDGQVGPGEEALYQTIWVNDTPTSFGDNIPGPPCMEDVADAPNVITGYEYFIPASQLGTLVGDPRVCAFINGSGHDFISNQVLGGIGLGAGNPGEPRLTRFADPSGMDPTGIPGDQFFTITSTSSTPPVLDGTLTGDESSYGAGITFQTTGTGFGDNTDPDPITAGGSELNGAYGVLVSGATDPADDGLYVLLTGNLETNFNKLEFFLDWDGDVSGQNKLRGDNPDVDFDGLNRMGDDGSDNGLVFDDGFAPDYYIQFTAGFDGMEMRQRTFGSAAELLTMGGGAGQFIGAGEPTMGMNLVSIVGAGEIGEGIEIAVNNSNVMGVGPGCFEPPLPDADFAVGSELDQVFAYIDSSEGSMGTLHVLAAGNLQTNFNKVLFFFDADAADGQNTLFGPTSTTPNVNLDFDKLNRLGFNDDAGDDPMNPLVTGPGLTFDAGMAPDYYVSVTNGNNPVAMFVNAAVLRATGPLVVTPPGINVDYGAFDGGTKSDAGNNPVLFDGDSADATFDLGPITDPSAGGLLFTNYGPRSTTQNILDFGIPVVPPAPGLLQVAIDNSNIAGMTTSSVAGADMVMTGVELAVDLEELGWDGTSDIKLTAFIVNDGHDTISNQITGGGVPDDGMGNQVNLGEPRVLDLSMLPGDQCINLNVPLPQGVPCADVNRNGNAQEPADFTSWLTLFNDPGNPLAYRADVNNNGNAQEPADFTQWLVYFNNPAADPGDCAP